MIKLNREGKGKELRMAVVETLQDIMKHDSKVVALEADLGGASGFAKFEKSNPERYVQCGVAEANMVGVAAGLSVTGFKPFIHSFAPFVSRRVFDQVFLSGAYAKNNINIYASDPGFTTGPNGGTHTTFEDIAMMRTIPNAVVCDPSDATQLEWIVKEFVNRGGINYVRANRKPVDNIYSSESTFEIGKGIKLSEGDDALIIATGQLVGDAFKAVDTLKEQGINVTLIDMFCIKPLDKDLIIKEAVNKKAIITLENHSIIGGLGSAVAEVMAENAIATKLTRMGINEMFGQVGTPEYIQADFKLCACDIVETVKNAIK